MKTRIVIGANLGDEGKGTVVATYAKHSKGNVLNVLTNGGAQRGHSILTENGSFTFQHFGSATYYGCDNYYSKFFILNPIQFHLECLALANRKIKFGKMYRHSMCLWSTPWDMMFNQIVEELREDKKHGSCGMGIWDTICRSREIYMTLDEFINLSYENKINYLKLIKGFYEKRVRILPKKWFDVWNDISLIDSFITSCLNLVGNVDIMDEIDPSSYDEIIFENGQGLLLNDTGKDIPGTTPSFTGVKDAMELITWDGSIELNYVTRPYLTRHGNGFLNEESLRNTISSSIDEDRTNQYNIHQGEFRYGILDIARLSERISWDASQCNKKYDLVLNVTHCDEMDRISEFNKLFNNVKAYDSALIK